jgi:hypothetical protein
MTIRERPAERSHSTSTKPKTANKVLITPFISNKFLNTKVIATALDTKGKK